MKLDVFKFALAGGIIGAISVGWTTLATLIGIPGFSAFASLLEQSYGFYGYSITWIGILIGAFWGFVEGFVWIGGFAFLYNRLLK